ncbi:hypothetical protein ABIB75_007763 [Bradyrhizobium sp. GM2.2]
MQGLARATSLDLTMAWTSEWDKSVKKVQLSI